MTGGLQLFFCAKCNAKKFGLPLFSGLIGSDRVNNQNKKTLENRDRIAVNTFAYTYKLQINPLRCDG